MYVYETTARGKHKKACAFESLCAYIKEEEIIFFLKNSYPLIRFAIYHHPSFGLNSMFRSIRNYLRHFWQPTIFLYYYRCRRYKLTATTNKKYDN